MSVRQCYFLCALLLLSCAGEEPGSEPGGVQGSGPPGGKMMAPPSAGVTAGPAAGAMSAGGATSTKPPASAGSGGSSTSTSTSAGAGVAGQTAPGSAAGGGGMVAQAGAGVAGHAGSAGSPGSNAGAGGAAGSGPTGTTSVIDPSCALWPKSTGDQPVTSSIRVSGTYDGKLKRYAGAGALGGGGQEEGQDPLFLLSNGATLENVILGAPAADGIHCEGACTLRNVWWEDVGEDAATLKGASGSQVMNVQCGGARKANDKVFQHNGPGTMKIENFIVEDFGKLYRSCGNCKTQHERHVEMKNVEATKGGVLAGINTNYGDTARFENILLHDTQMKLGVCDRFTGNSSGAEPSKIGSGADGSSCMYDDASIQRVP